MYKQVLSEADSIDVIPCAAEGTRRSSVELIRAMDEGRLARGSRERLRAWPTFATARRSLGDARRRRERSKDLDGITPDWSLLEMGQLHLRAVRREGGRSRTWRAAVPLPCSFCSQWKFWRDYRVRDPIKVVGTRSRIW